jgi:hypothetical protein
MTAEMTPAKNAGFVDSNYRKGNQKRIEQDELELKQLMEGVEVPKKEEAAPDVKEAAPVSKEEESFKKRYGDLRRHMQEKEKEWQDRFEKLENQLKGSTSLMPPKSEEDVEDWVRKHPDVAAIVTALAAKEAEKKVSGTQERLRKLDADQAEITRQKAEQIIRDSHPDFDDLRSADEFHSWAEDQPKWVQDAIYENADDPRSVIRVIDLYKVDKGLNKQATKQRDKEAAGFVKPGGKTQVAGDAGGFSFSESQVNKMTMKEYEANEQAIVAAMRSGKFKYDLTGGAR